jgi:hypothetical protein
MQRRDAAMSDFDDAPKDYEVGYCKPPKASQFKKGQSGFPSGRPKEKGNLLTFFNTELDREISTSSGRQVPQREMYVRALIERASQGHSPSFRKFIELATRAHLFDKPPDSKPTCGPIYIERNVAYEQARNARLRAELADLEARIASGELKEVKK